MLTVDAQKDLFILNAYYFDGYDDQIGIENPEDILKINYLEWMGRSFSNRSRKNTL